MVLRRVRDRSYLLTTALVYALIAFFFMASPLGIVQAWPLVLTVTNINASVWAGLFSITAILAAASSLFKHGIWQKVALTAAAVVAGGFTGIFAYQALLGTVTAIVPMVVWGYITAVHIIMTKYHDPNTVTIIQQDIAFLKREMQVLKEGRKCHSD